MSDQEEKLRQEILGDAGRRAERAVSRAERDGRTALETARKELDDEREQELGKARRRGEERYIALTARIRHDIRRQWLAAREQCLEELLSETLAKVISGETVDRGESCRQLLREAFEAMGPGEMVVRIRPVDASLLGPESIAEILKTVFGASALEARVEIRHDEKMDAGIQVESADGRRIFDNTYRMRLRRLKASLRAILAEEQTDTDGVEQS